MAEVLFYHLERQPLEAALPGLLKRSLDRSWRVVVKVGSPERLEALNAHLWAFDDTSFLPHGAAADGRPEAQPIYLTLADENPNGATVRFLVDGAEAGAFGDYQRTVFLFDAADEAAVERSRIAWKMAREGGHEATYWRQDERGRWTKQG